MPLRSSLPLTVLTTLLVVSASQAAEPTLRTLDSHFPFTPPASLEAWEQQATEVRLRTQVALGVYPAPELAKPVAQIYGAVQRDNYTVEKIAFESLPGFWVTGSLYRPYPLPKEPMPGFLSPHGHWADGRFYDAGRETARKELASGAERFEAAARHPLQARCVQLARMGCTVLHWDMVGYADSIQLDFGRMHGNRDTKNAPAPVTDNGWLLLSVPAEANQQSIPGLQTLNTWQATRVLLSLPGIDPKRIGITGASGGGTQSFIGSALDPAITASFPAVMVSTGMQGGCTCENACHLRIGQGNVHLAALTAPRPLGMTAADDWTRNMANDGFPELVKLYQLYGHKERVRLAPFLHFGHNFNHVSATQIYGWVNEYFKLGLESPVLESDFKPLTKEEMSVWDANHPKPPAGVEYERSLTKVWKEKCEAALELLVEQAKQDHGKAYRETVRNATRILIGADTVAATGEFTSAQGACTLKGPLQLEQPAVRFPAANGSKQPPVILAADKLDDFVIDGKLKAPWDQLSAAGRAVVIVKVTLDPTANGEQPLVENRRAAAFTFGYNLTYVAKSALLLLATADAVKDAEGGSSPVLIASQSAAPAAALALAAKADAFQAAAVDTHGFRFESVASIADPLFLPGGSRYGDLPGLLAAAAPVPLLVDGEQAASLAWAQRLYAASGAESGLTISAGDFPSASVRWVNGQKR